MDAWHRLVSLESESGEHPYIVALRKLLGQIELGRTGIEDGDYTVEDGRQLAKRARARIILHEEGGAQVWDYRGRMENGRTLRIWFDGQHLWQMEQRTMGFCDLVGDVKKMILERCSSLEARLLMTTCREMARFIGRTGRQWEMSHPLPCLQLSPKKEHWEVWPCDPITASVLNAQVRQQIPRWVLPYDKAVAALAWEYIIFLHERREGGKSLIGDRAVLAPPSLINGILYLVVLCETGSQNNEAEMQVIRNLKKHLVYPPNKAVRLKKGNCTIKELDWKTI